MTWFETNTYFQAMLTWLQTITQATSTYYTIGADHGLMWVHVNRYVRNHEYIYIYTYMCRQCLHWIWYHRCMWNKVPIGCQTGACPITFPDQQIHDFFARTAASFPEDMPHMTNTITHMLCNMEAYTFMAITFKPKFWIGKYITD